jgi:hypothetical protein
VNPDEQADEREPEQAGWLAMLGHVNSRPRYPNRSSNGNTRGDFRSGRLLCLCCLTDYQKWPDARDL